MYSFILVPPYNLSWLLWKACCKRVRASSVPYVMIRVRWFADSTNPTILDRSFLDFRQLNFENRRELKFRTGMNIGKRHSKLSEFTIFLWIRHNGSRVVVLFLKHRCWYETNQRQQKRSLCRRWFCMSEPESGSVLFLIWQQQTSKKVIDFLFRKNVGENRRSEIRSILVLHCISGACAHR